MSSKEKSSPPKVSKKDRSPGWWWWWWWWLRRGIDRSNGPETLRGREGRIHICVFQILGIPDSYRRARPPMTLTTARSLTDGWRRFCARQFVTIDIEIRPLEFENITIYSSTLTPKLISCVVSFVLGGKKEGNEGYFSVLCEFLIPDVNDDHHGSSKIRPCYL